ncbi:hypothetical protein HDK90DRAFT_58964 [Phyllosticta capitalensis]|uniref:Uncharacterized protein n=1 Tax=Phyllosticta capitalensis TaxID=121624 RepID=A0ABR1YGF0_9PEZI
MPSVKASRSPRNALLETCYGHQQQQRPDLQPGGNKRVQLGCRPGAIRELFPPRGSPSIKTNLLSSCHFLDTPYLCFALLCFAVACLLDLLLLVCRLSAPAVVSFAASSAVSTLHRAAWTTASTAWCQSHDTLSFFRLSWPCICFAATANVATVALQN